MTDDDEREAVRKRRAELVAQLVEASGKIRDITDADIQEATVDLGRLKVQVAKLIKEQRDRPAPLHLGFGREDRFLNLFYRI